MLYSSSFHDLAMTTNILLTFFSYVIFTEYYNLALGTKYSFGYLKIENAIIKLSSYNYKYHKSRKKIEVEGESSHWSQTYRKLKVGF